MSEEFSHLDWRHEGKTINSNIQRFEKLFNELEQNLEQAKDEENIDSSTIQTVEDGLNSIRAIQGNIRSKKEKQLMIIIIIQNYQSKDNPGENEEEEQQKGQVVMDLMTNKEVLEQRGKALQENT